MDGWHAKYENLTERLDGQAEMYLTELRVRKRRENESLRELGQRIQCLVSLAYLEIPADKRDRLARGHFVDAITDRDLRIHAF